MSRRRGRLWLVPFVVGGCVRLHTPAGPVMPDRPGFTDTPTVLPAGAAQIETGFTDDQSGGSRYQSAGEVLVRVGVAGPLELRLFGNSYAWRTAPGAPVASGVEDFKVGVKLRLMEKPDSVHSFAPNLALLVATTLPTGARDIGAGAAQPEAKLAASWTTATPFSFDSNVGFGAIYDGAAWSDHAWGSVATWYAATPRISLFVEGIHTYHVSGPAASPTYVDGGVTLLFGDRLQFDARFGSGAGGSAANERFAGIGLGVRF